MTKGFNLVAISFCSLSLCNVTLHLVYFMGAFFSLKDVTDRDHGPLGTGGVQI